MCGIEEAKTRRFPRILARFVDELISRGSGPCGRYELTVQILHRDGSVVDGLLLERDVVIQ